MNASIEETLQRSLRDACLSVYLEDVARRDPNLGKVQGRLNKPEDVYEYLLVDPLVEPAVRTTRGALAVASLQQYVNGIILGMEPGYEAKLSEGPVAEWREKTSQYPLWAANMMLESYPEAYIDPTLRLRKSGYFVDLEQTINQTKINTDTVGDAVLDYLSKFEEVANLKVINGYIANHEMAEGTWYFIGKPRTELTKYYWRSVDMTLHADGVQELAPGAWSDWEPVDFPVAEGAVIEESCIRPVYFNKRLYVVWAEKRLLIGDTQVEVDVPTESGGTETKHAGEPPRTELALKMIYRRYDGTWSTPFTYARTEVEADPPEPLQTIALYDVSMSPYRLIIGMYYGFRKVKDSELGIGNACAFMRNVEIDQSFNVKRVFPVSHDDMEAANDDSQMGVTEKYIRAVYHFLLVKSGKLEHPERTILMAETALIKSKGLEFEHVAEQNSFGEHFPGVLDKFSIAADNSRLGALHVEISASIPLAGFDWHKPEANLIEVGSYSQPRFRLDGIMQKMDGILTFVSGQIVFQSNFFPEMPGRFIVPFVHYWQTDEWPLSTKAGTPATIDTEAAPASFDLEGLNFLDLSEERLLHSTLTINFRNISEGLDSYSAYFYGVLLDVAASYVELGIFYHDSSSASHTTRAQNGDDQVRMTWDGFRLNVGAEGEAIETIFFVSLRSFKRDNTLIASASRRLTVVPGGTVIEVSPGTNKGIPPYLAQRHHPSLGTAEYIEFAGSEMATVEGTSRRPIRMNTLFANALINKANQGLEHLLQWSVQQMAEPPMAGQSGVVTMDFHGANGLYFWELFFYLPFLASVRLNREQSHADAEHWLRFVFDHTDKSGNLDTGKPPYWNVVPLVADESVAGRLTDLVMAPSDPDVIAAAYPVHYRKAVFLYFIRNLIDRGDLAYRQQTPDSLTEAKQWYVHAADLLGPAPAAGQVSQWTPRPLSELAGAQHGALRAWEQQVAGELLCIPLHGRAVRAPRELNPHFRLPLNETLIEAWRTVATRLYNLRHSLTLDGKPMTLPLFAPPQDPQALMASRSQAGSGGGTARAGQMPWPHFRFGVIQERAHRGVDTLTMFGNTVLGLIERQERAQQEQLQQSQLWEMSDFVIAGHSLNIEVLEQGRVALQRIRESVELRHRHYRGLYDENVSGNETRVLDLETTAKSLELAASVAFGVGHVLRMVPNNIGAGAGVTGGVVMVGLVPVPVIGGEAEVQVGGTDWGALAYAIGDSLTAASHGANIASSILATTEAWRRRRQEWELQYRLAESELSQLDEQLAMTDLQIAAARHMKLQATEERARQKTMLAFLTSRFTSDTLYQWLLGQVCAVYFQVYDLVVGLCLTAEAACQYETGDYATRFIRPGGWNDTWRGLTVGENLKLDLLRMDNAYLAGRPRELEITRTVSLRELFGEDAWQGVLDNLRGKGATRGSLAGRNGENGQVSFELSERLFDEDYPGMYLRRLVSVSVSLPAVLGAYQDVKALLSQTASYVVISPSAEAVASLLDPAKTPTEQVKLNLRPGQQIAVSHGVEDTGLLTPAFPDERYLPFEGTGAVSAWMLRFPNPESAAQMAAFESLTDIIVRVRYTARHGGRAFKEEVLALLEDANG